MNLRNKIIEKFENENLIVEAEKLEKLPRVCVGNMPSGNVNLNELPLITKSTIPERKEPEQIVMLDLKYSTNHLNGKIVSYKQFAGFLSQDGLIIVMEAE